MKRMAVFAATILACMAGFSFAKQSAKQPVEAEPQFEGVYSYWDASVRGYISLPRETPEEKAKARALGFGGAKVYLHWPTQTCAVRFNSARLPKFAVRVASTQKDPHEIIKLYKLEVAKDGRRLSMASTGVLGISSKSTTEQNAVGFSAQVFGKSSLLITPDSPLAPGEYVFSSTDSQNSYCFGVDAGASSAAAPAPRVAQTAPPRNPVVPPPAPVRAPAPAAPQYSNDPRVSFRASCPGLYITRVYETRYEGMIPSYALDFVNTSDNRYEVSYDLTYTQRGEGPYLGRSVKSYTDEKHFTSRGGNPDTSYTIWLAEKQVNGAYVISSIDKVEVFKCEKT